MGSPTSADGSAYAVGDSETSEGGGSTGTILLVLIFVFVCILLVVCIVAVVLYMRLRAVQEKKPNFVELDEAVPKTNALAGGTASSHSTTAKSTYPVPTRDSSMSASDASSADDGDIENRTPKVNESTGGGILYDARTSVMASRHAPRRSQNYSARPPEQSHGVDDDKLMSMTVIELKKYLGDHGVPREEYRSVFNKDMLRAKIQALGGEGPVTAPTFGVRPGRGFHDIRGSAAK